jgi:hypothetical protein
MVAMLKQIISVYWQVLCFKKSPEDTPSSPVMCGIALCLTLAASLLQYQLASVVSRGSGSVFLVLLVTFIQVLLFSIYTRFVLWTNNAGRSFLQLLTCWLMMMFFLDIISSILMAVLLGISQLGLAQVINQFLQTLGIAFGIVFSIWQVTFVIHLFKVFLRKNFLVGLLIYLGWLGINYLLLMLLKGL